MTVRNNLHNLTIEDLFKLIFSRKLLLVVGEWGKGKSLVLTTLAYYWTVMTEGKRFLSNIPINFKELNPFIEVLPLVETSQFDEQNLRTLVLLDEGQRYFDRRDHNKPETKFVMGWAVDLRKDDCQIVSTIQYLDWLENRATDFLQMAIVPQFVNNYSIDEAENIKMRLINKDFLSHWKIVDYKMNMEYDLVINMYPFINMYDTRFKAKKLVVNHKEYLDYKKDKWSGKKFEAYLEECESEKKGIVKNWNFAKERMLETNDSNLNGSVLDELHNEHFSEEEKPDIEDIEEETDLEEKEDD